MKHIPIGASCAVSLALLAQCGQLEQAEPSRDLRMFVRVFVAPDAPDPDVAACEDIGAQFTLVATPGPGNDADNMARKPTNTVAFEHMPTISDDPSDGMGEELVHPGGCIVGTTFKLTTGPWLLGVTRAAPDNSVAWNTTCEVLISTDESTTNSPWAGFSANGIAYDVVNSTTGCVYENIDVVNNQFP